VELTHVQYWRTPTPSATFHGRDIFAPVGAHLASGVPWTALGPAIPVCSLVQFQMPHPVPQGPSDHASGLIGCIQTIDHFGNGITTISGAAVLAQSWSVVVGNITIPSRLTYSEAGSGDLVALVGSHGWVEVAVNGGSARDRLALAVGDAVQVVVQK
jgi:S-adenosyl-L-methionine hydrolase (adenosine-forming)